MKFNNSEDQNPVKLDPFDGPYVGNIWGKKMTLWGGVFILLMLAMVLYRHWRLDAPFGLEEEQPLFEKPYYQQKAEEAARALDSLDNKH